MTPLPQSKLPVYAVIFLKVPLKNVHIQVDS